LIFANFESDTGLIYSDRCSASIKKISEIKPSEIEILNQLSKNYFAQIKLREVESSQIKIKPELEDFQEEMEAALSRNTPSRKINKLQLQIANLETENRKLKIIAAGVTGFPTLNANNNLNSPEKKIDFICSCPRAARYIRGRCSGAAPCFGRPLCRGSASSHKRDSALLRGITGSFSVILL